MVFAAASLFRLLFAVLGVYLVLKAIGWIARQFLSRPNKRITNPPGGEKRNDGRSIRNEDIQDARYTEVDPDA